MTDHFTTLCALLQADPGNVELACAAADAALTQRGAAEAAQFIDALSPSLRAEPGIRFRRARASIAQGNYPMAVSLLEALSAEYGANGAVLHDLAFARLCLGELDTARDLVVKAQAVADDPMLHLLAARIAHAAGRTDEALQALDRAADGAEKQPLIDGLRALVLLDADRRDEAAVAANAALALDADQHEALIVSGTVALWAESAVDAEAAFGRALARHADSGRALLGLGQARMLAGRPEEAMALLAAATQALPTHVGTWHALAWCHLIAGSFVEARGCFEHAFGLDRNFADSLAGLALMDVIDGKLADAEAALRKAQRLDAASATLRYAQSLLADARGDERAASQALASLVEAAPRPIGVDPAVLRERLRAHLLGGNRSVGNSGG